MIMKVNLGDDSYGNAKYVPAKTITRKGVVRNHRNIPVKTKNGLVQRFKKVDVYSTPAPDVVNRSSPLSSDAAEALVNMTLETSPEPVSYNPEDLMEKCTVSGSPSCPMLRDALSQLSAEVRWARDQAAAILADTEAECKRLSEDYERQTQEWELILEDNNAKLSETTGMLNTAEENLRQKVLEANELLKMLGSARKECVKKIKEGAETICGIKSIRQELYQMQTYNPFIEDCEVGEWSPGECSVECGGGERTLMREVVTPASNGGAECPIMIEKEPCNMQPCPIDCVVDMWSEYGECSKECDWGVTFRVKGVAKEGGPEGYCPEWYDEARLEAAYCNTMECPQDLVCTAQLDMLLLLDGSGSVNWYGPGFEQERQFALNMFNLMSFGDAGAKAGVILFSWEAELVHPMSTDGASLIEAVEGMSWPHWNTDTAAALTMAKTELTNSGRPEVSKEKTIVFLLTDGNPNSMSATYAAADAIKEVATLYVVIIGDNVNMGAVKYWPSYPWEEHLIKIDEFELLTSHMEAMLADVCTDLGCRESMTGNGQDYIGCQYQTVSGYTCQNWLDQTPQSQDYIGCQYQ